MRYYLIQTIMMAYKKIMRLYWVLRPVMKNNIQTWKRLKKEALFPHRWKKNYMKAFQTNRYNFNIIIILV